MTSDLQVTPLSETFAARIDAIQVAGITRDSGYSEVREALQTFGVLVFPAQILGAEQHLAFANLFGELETFPQPTMQKGSDKIYNVSNVDDTGAMAGAQSLRMLMLKGTHLWHTDSSYRDIPALASFLYAIEIPEADEVGGETEFADMLAAHDALPDDLRRRLAGRHMVHNYEHERIYLERRLPEVPLEQKALQPPVSHPVLRYHPERNRHSVYLSASVGREFSGLPHKQGRALFQETLEFVTQSRFVYRHCWTQGDLVVWDNRRLLHRVLPYDIERVRRVMRRSAVAGSQPPLADWMEYDRR